MSEDFRRPLVLVQARFRGDDNGEWSTWGNMKAFEVGNEQAAEEYRRRLHRYSKLLQSRVILRPRVETLYAF